MLTGDILLIFDMMKKGVYGDVVCAGSIACDKISGTAESCAEIITKKSER